MINGLCVVDTPISLGLVAGGGQNGTIAGSGG